MATQRPSSTSVTTDAPIAIYSNSKEATDLSPNYIRVIPGNSIGAIFSASEDITYEDLTGDIAAVVDSTTATDAESTPAGSVIAEKPTLLVPSLSDIEVVSNTVVYDAAGNPSVTVIFKVKNNSGTTLKGMNARVKVI